MNPQSLLEITSECQESLRSCFTIFQQRTSVDDEDAEVEPALSPSACPLPRCHREPGLTEMEGLLFDSAPGGLLIVSKWSPPATALIIHDPTCMLEDRRGGRDQQPRTCVCLCVSSQEKGKKKKERWCRERIKKHSDLQR